MSLSIGAIAVYAETRFTFPAINDTVVIVKDDGPAKLRLTPDWRRNFRSVTQGRV